MSYFNKMTSFDDLKTLYRTAKEPITVKALITAEIAAWMLMLDTVNRPLNEERVLPIMRSLIAGLYVFTGQGVLFTRCGSDKFAGLMCDGQHRLVAIVRTGIAVEMNVTLGLSPKAIEFIDGARQRQVYDTIMTVRGTKYAKHSSTYVRQAARLLAGEYVVLSYAFDFDEWSGLFAAGLDMAVEHLAPDRDFRTAQFAAALVFAYAANPAAVRRFGVNVTTGANLRAGDPALVLRNYILKGAWKACRAGGKNPMLLANMTLNALKAAVLGKKMVAVDPSPEGVEYFRAKTLTSKAKKHIASWQAVRAIPHVEVLPVSSRMKTQKEFHVQRLVKAKRAA